MSLYQTPNGKQQSPEEEQDKEAECKVNLTLLKTAIFYCLNLLNELGDNCEGIEFSKSHQG
jgi:hypothetical protein